MARAPSGLPGPPATKCGRPGWRVSISSGGVQSGHSFLAEILCSPDQVKPGNKMYVNGYVGMKIQVSDSDAVAIAAFLSSLK